MRPRGVYDLYEFGSDGAPEPTDEIEVTPPE